MRLLVLFKGPPLTFFEKSREGPCPRLASLGGGPRGDPRALKRGNPKGTPLGYKKKLKINCCPFSPREKGEIRKNHQKLIWVIPEPTYRLRDTGIPEYSLENAKH